MLYDRQADFEADARLGQTIAFYGVAGTGQIWLRNDLVSFVMFYCLDVHYNDDIYVATYPYCYQLAQGNTIVSILTSFTSSEILMCTGFGNHWMYFGD